VIVGMARSFVFCELKLVIVVADSVRLHGRRRRRPRRRRCPRLARVSSAPATAVRMDPSLGKASVRQLLPAPEHGPLGTLSWTVRVRHPRSAPETWPPGSFLSKASVARERAAGGVASTEAGTPSWRPSAPADG